LFRVFVELSVDKFMNKYNMQTCKVANSKTYSFSLSTKLQNTAEYMSKNGMAVQNELKGVRTMANKKDGEFTIDGFNDYVHNRYLSPKVDSLITGWDNIQVFMEKLWSNV